MLTRTTRYSQKYIRCLLYNVIPTHHYPLIILISAHTRGICIILCTSSVFLLYAPCGKSVHSLFRHSADGTKSRRQSVVVQIDRTEPRSTSNSAVITHFDPVRSERTWTKGIITELDLLWEILSDSGHHFWSISC